VTPSRDASRSGETGFDALDETITLYPPWTCLVAVSTSLSIMCASDVMKVRMNTTSAYMAIVRPVRERRASG
jgi:hypothetical protein